MLRSPKYFIFISVKPKERRPVDIHSWAWLYIYICALYPLTHLVSLDSRAGPSSGALDGKKEGGILRAQLPNLYASSPVFYYFHLLFFFFPPSSVYLMLEKWKTRYCCIPPLSLAARIHHLDSTAN